MMGEKRCSNCRYYERNPNCLGGHDGLCRRRDPHPKYGFPVLAVDPETCWCGEWMPTEELNVFATSPRDNFLEVVDRWVKYVDRCQRIDATPMTLDEFRQHEVSWDT